MRRVIARWLFRFTNPSALRQIEALSFRVMELEAALRAHAIHDEQCGLSTTTGIFVWHRNAAVRRWHEGDYDAGCTCHLAAVIEPHRKGHDRLGHIG